MIHDALGPHLINWERSTEMERNATRVRVITRDLCWAALETPRILQELSENNDHSYEYIVFGNNPDAPGRITALQAAAKEKGVGDRVTVHVLNGLPGWMKIDDHAWLDLPLLGDLSIYENTFVDDNDQRETVVVMNLRPIPAPSDKSSRTDDDEKPRFAYDVMFHDERMKNNAIGWFNTIVNLLAKADA